MLSTRAAISSSIMLNSGSVFDLTHPNYDKISIEDIAHGLSLTCRYAGQCNSFYSVAEHSVLVSSIVTRRVGLEALLHDAAEAFIGDITRPLKHLLPDFQEIETKILKAIFERFQLEFPLAEEVKLADDRVMAAELQELMPSGTNKWLQDLRIRPAQVVIRGLTPEAAKSVFLERFSELT